MQTKHTLLGPDGILATTALPFVIDWATFPGTVKLQMLNYAGTEWLESELTRSTTIGIYGNTPTVPTRTLTLAYFANGYVGWLARWRLFFNVMGMPPYFDLTCARAYDVTADPGATPLGNYTTIGLYNPYGELSSLPDWLKPMRVLA